METHFGLRMERPDHVDAAALPTTDPLDQLHWKLNAGSRARPLVAIGQYVLRAANIPWVADALVDR